MGNIAGFINSLNQITQTIGAVQGAADTLAPAFRAVDQTVNQIAGVFTGDQYVPQPYPSYPVYPPIPIGFSNDGKIGVVGSMLAGGVAGAITHQQASDAITTIRSGQTGAGFKALGMSSLKAGAIGAGITGIISAAKNMSLTSKGLQTSADSAGNIAADTVGGLLSGATGGVAAGAAGLALNGMGVAGVGLTIGVTVAGAVGAAVSHLLFNGTGARDGVANTVRNMAGGRNQYVDPYGQGQYGQNQNYGYR